MRIDDIVTAAPETSELGGGFTLHTLTDVAHLIFGQLVRLSQPHIERYYADLWHDAAWIGNNVTGEHAEFWFGADADGTAIGTDASLVARYRTNAWRITCDVTLDRWERKVAHISIAAVVRPEGWRK